MARTPEGYAVYTAEVVSADGPCHAGHKVGDRLSLSCYDSGGLCGFFYHDLFPALSVIQFGGKYPWSAPGELRAHCPDAAVNLTLVIREAKA